MKNKKRELWIEEINDVGLYDYRKPTPREVDDATLIEAERQELEEIIASAQAKLKVLCKSKEAVNLRVFYDSPGHPYDIRTYITTGLRGVV